MTEDILYIIVLFGILILLMAILNSYFKNTLFFFIFTLFVFGCASMQTKEPLFIKCQVPEVPKLELYSFGKEMNYPEKLQVILNNYFIIQKENELLRKAMEVCK